MSAPTATAQTATGFAASLAEFGTRTALHTPAGSVSYAELNEHVVLAQDQLATVATQTRQLIHLEPARTLEFVVAWLASLRGGHATLISHSPLLARNFGTSMTATGKGGEIRWIPTGIEAPHLHADLRLLLSTSGSTGSAKLVRLSSDNLNANAASIAEYLELSERDVALTTLPFDYCYGLSVLHSHLQVGGAVMLDDRSVTDQRLWLDARREGVTSFAGVPYTFDLLRTAAWPDLPSLRQVTQAGGRMAPEHVRDLARKGEREGWGLVVMYGQTEATARMAYLPPHLAAKHPDAVGIAIPGGQFRVDPVPEAEAGTGELVYSGPNVMMGYAQSSTDLAIGPSLRELHTGDLASIGGDGLVRIVGRRARFAKLFGKRVDLDRLQTALQSQGYEAGCAEGARSEQLVVAIAGDPPKATQSAIASSLASEISLPTHAIHVVGVADLPRLPNGKLDHPMIAGLASLGPTGSLPRPSTDCTTNRPIPSVFREILGRDEIADDDSFVSLGGDSLSYVELSLRLEQRLGKLPADWPRRTVGNLSALDEAATPSRRRVIFLDTTVILRAVAIVMIVGAHTNLWTVMGAAHVLLAVVGANFARFQLGNESGRANLRRVAQSTARIAVPAVIWIGAVSAVTGDYPWRTVLLLNDVLGSPHWSEPEWHFWFIDVVVVLMLGTGVLCSIPALHALQGRHPFWLPIALTATALLPTMWATAAGYDGDIIHSSQFIAWLFFGGWAAAVAGNVPERLAVSILLLLGTYGFTGDPVRDGVIATGVLVLTWCPTLPWLPQLRALTGLLASASLFIYLTHWQVYPHLEDRWPLGGLLASLVVGLLAWRLASQVPSWIRRIPHHPLFGSTTPQRQDV